MNLNDVARGGTLCLSSAGLAVGSTAQKIKIAAPNGAGVDYAINGKLYHKADTDDLFLFTGLTQAADTTCLYLMLLNSAGTASIVQGTAVTSTDYNSGDAVLHWPEPTAGTCCVGAIKLVTTAVFTGTTTALGTGNTATYYNLMTVPNVPMTYDND
jgi:hypothetical protein